MILLAKQWIILNLTDKKHKLLLENDTIYIKYRTMVFSKVT